VWNNSANSSGGLPNLASSNLQGVSSGAINGTFAGLPAGWSVMGGYLIGPGANLSGAKLSGFNLTGVTLTAANLSGADLSKTTLTGANLAYSSFANATLSGSVVSGQAPNVTGAFWSNTTCQGGAVQAPCTFTSTTAS
jgi:uncharacterized protein YjbI with pentapeptide repeats